MSYIKGSWRDKLQYLQVKKRFDWYVFLSGISLWATHFFSILRFLKLIVIMYPSIPFDPLNNIPLMGAWNFTNPCFKPYIFRAFNLKLEMKILIKLIWNNSLSCKNTFWYPGSLISRTCCVHSGWLALLTSLFGSFNPFSLWKIMNIINLVILMGLKHKAYWKGNKNKDATSLLNDCKPLKVKVIKNCC